LNAVGLVQQQRGTTTHKGPNDDGPFPQTPCPHFGSADVEEGGSNAAPFLQTAIPRFRIILGLENAGRLGEKWVLLRLEGIMTAFKLML